MARSKKKRSKKIPPKKQCRKIENESTPRKKRSTETPYTPRIHLINLDINNMPQDTYTRSFTIISPNMNKVHLKMTPSEITDNIIIVPSPQSKKLDSQSPEGINNQKLCGNSDEGSGEEADLFSDMNICSSKFINKVNVVSSPLSKKQESQSLDEMNPLPCTDSDEEPSEEPDLFSEFYTNRSKSKNTVVSSFQTSNRVKRRLNFEIDKDQESCEDSEEKPNSSSDDPYEDSGSEYVPSEIEEVANDIGDELEDMTYFEHIQTNDERQHLNGISDEIDWQHLESEPKMSFESGHEYNEDTEIFEQNAISDAIDRQHLDVNDLSSKSSDFDFDSSTMLVTAKSERSKKQACLFCNSLVVQLPRHFKRKHYDHPSVQKMLACTNKEEKQHLLSQLRKEGNFIYNSKVLETGKGQLIVKRRPEKHSKYSHEFLPCSNCLAFYTKNALFRHMKYCDVKKRKWSRVQANCSNLLPINKSATSLLKKNVLSIMHQDNITLVIKGDDLILKYGSNLCEKFSAEDEKHLAVHVSQKMRELGRLLLAVAQVNGKHLKLVELIDPKHFDLIVESTKIVACYDSNTGVYNKPSIAQKLGFSLIQCSTLLKACAIRHDNQTLRKICDDFEYLFRNEWNIKVGRHARNSLERARYNKPTLLPLAQDIRTLNTYLIENECRLSADLLQTYSYAIWAELSEIILTKLILFNRRRAGEVNRLSIKNFDNRSNNVDKSDVFASLTEVEKTLTRRFTYVEFRGKRGRKVPLLMPRATESNIILILKFRSRAGVPDTNPYVFGKLNDSSHFDGCATLRKIAKVCNLIHPESLRSTKLRKHVATMSQVMCLREHEMDSLANFMGHDPRIHRQFYKLPDAAIHLAKVSKVLLAMERGNVESYKGKNFDTINIEVEADRMNELENESDDSEEGEKLYQVEATMCENRFEHKKKEIIKKHQTKRIYWNSLEISAIKRQLSHYLQSEEVPGMGDCLKCIKREPDLRNRSWKNVKYWVYNYIKKSSIPK